MASILGMAAIVAAPSGEFRSGGHGQFRDFRRHGFAPVGSGRPRLFDCDAGAGRDAGMIAAAALDAPRQQRPSGPETLPRRYPLGFPAERVRLTVRALDIFSAGHRSRHRHPGTRLFRPLRCRSHPLHCGAGNSELPHDRRRLHTRLQRRPNDSFLARRQGCRLRSRRL